MLKPDATMMDSMFVRMCSSASALWLFFRAAVFISKRSSCSEIVKKVWNNFPRLLKVLLHFVPTCAALLGVMGKTARDEGCCGTVSPPSGNSGDCRPTFSFTIKEMRHGGHVVVLWTKHARKRRTGTLDSESSSCFITPAPFTGRSYRGGEGGGRFPGEEQKNLVEWPWVLLCPRRRGIQQSADHFLLGLLSKTLMAQKREGKKKKEKKANGCHCGNGLIASGRP